MTQQSSGAVPAVPPTQTTVGTALPTGQAQPKKATPMAQHIPAQRQPDHGALGELADRAVQVLRAHYDTVQHGYCDVCHLEWPCDTVLRADSNLALLH
jgi:hypothetical protein